jgi:hypothetical protein
MRNIFAIFFVMCLVQTASAGLSFMETPYSLLDQAVMPVWKPLIKLFLISWAQNIVCVRYVDLILDAIDIKSEMTDEESKTYCTDGIQSFVDGFFYAGTIENKPTTFGWSWSAADDFA